MGKIEQPKFGFLGLLICLVSLIVIVPFLQEFSPARPVVRIFSTAVLILSVYSFVNKKRVLVIASLLGAPAFIFNWISYSFQTSTVLLIKDVFNAAFCAYIVVAILSEIFRKKTITLNMIYGSICVYLLIGLAWAYVYAVLENIHPGSFSFPLHYFQAHPSLSESQSQSSLLFYYSYVTLSTLGYGDITPVTHPAQSIAVLEAITGQFYLAVLVARLVGIHIYNRSQL